MVRSARNGDTGDSRARRVGGRADYRHVGAMVVRRVYIAVATHLAAVEAIARHSGTGGVAEAAGNVPRQGARP
ncbi:MAG: hypothetical protein ACKVS8_03830 [Phycisphaerales bacterium]